MIIKLHEIIEDCLERKIEEVGGSRFSDAEMAEFRNCSRMSQWIRDHADQLSIGINNIQVQETDQSGRMTRAMVSFIIKK